MNFYWNAHSPLNLFIDFVVLFTLPAFLGWFLRRKGLPLFPLQVTGAWWIWFFSGILAYAVLFRIASALTLFLTGFMMIHMFWTFLTVVLPAGLGYAAVKHRRFWLLLPVAGILAVKFYAEAVEVNRLEVSEVAVRNRAFKEELRIAHISDLQTDNIRELHREALAAVQSFRPHAVVFTGDVLNHERVIPEVYKYLQEMHVPGRSYFVTGNVDGILDLSEFERETGFRVFDGKTDVISAGSTRTAVLGLGLKDFGDFELLEKMQRDTRNADYRILISHYPDSVFMASKRGVHLVFAGHTHGGQVVIPFFGPPITLSRVPRSIAAGGIHSYNGTQIIVSRGLGVEGHVAPRIRFLCRPQLILARLLPEQGVQ